MEYQWFSRRLNDLAIQHDSRSFSRDLQVSGYPHPVAVKHPDIENIPMDRCVLFLKKTSIYHIYIYIYMIYIYIYHIYIYHIYIYISFHITRTSPWNIQKCCWNRVFQKTSSAFHRSSPGFLQKKTKVSSTKAQRAIKYIAIDRMKVPTGPWQVIVIWMILEDGAKNIWLVLWNHGTLWRSMTFHSVGHNHHPNWRTKICFRGVGIPPTRLLSTIINHIITYNNL